MTFSELPLPGSFLIALAPVQDDRGFFARTFCAATLRRHGLVDTYPQANHSMCAAPGTLRGLHYQGPPAAEAKLFRCVAGRVFDVLVDVRRDSTTFLKWHGVELAAGDFRVVYVPPGFAHGYQALTAGAEVAYQSSAEYAPALEGRVRYDDPRVGVAWPVAPAILSPKDAATPLLAADFAGVEL
jgi:dTDP-4-dehydrorhamnose 3,5-epimerase